MRAPPLSLSVSPGLIRSQSIVESYMMMKFVISRNRGAYYVSPPQGDALGQEVAEASGKEEPGRSDEQMYVLCSCHDCHCSHQVATP